MSECVCVHNCAYDVCACALVRESVRFRSQFLVQMTDDW